MKKKPKKNNNKKKNHRNLRLKLKCVIKKKNTTNKQWLKMIHIIIKKTKQKIGDCLSNLI